MRNTAGPAAVHLVSNVETALRAPGGSVVDCFFHSSVPAVAPCAGCGHAICASCRDRRGDCPSCRLAAKMERAASARGRLAGEVAPPAPPPRAASPAAHRSALAGVAPETRALVALGYPFWPLAALALLDPSRSSYLKRQAYQALGFNFGIYGLWYALHFIAMIPLLGMSAWPVLWFMLPVAFVASVVYGIQAWNGDDVRVPFVSEWLGRGEPA